MSSVTTIDWSDVQEAAKALAGNWREFDCFAWHRSFDLEDADNWAICYTSNRDSGLLAESNERAINDALEEYADGDDPDLVFERHSHWACGYVDGFSIRVYRTDGGITDAFKEFCRIKERLEDYPPLDEEDYSRREYEGTLENYANEMWGKRSDLPDGWEEQVYRHFSDTGQYEYVENRDDQGGWVPREKLVEALVEMGVLQPEND